MSRKEHNEIENIDIDDEIGKKMYKAIHDFFNHPEVRSLMSDSKYKDLDKSKDRTIDIDKYAD